MTRIDAETTLDELAALVSQALERAGVRATLSGGAAVSLYSDNEYESKDLDFVSTERLKVIGEAISPLGFARVGGAREFENAATKWYLEFPSGPLAFGETYVPDDETHVLETDYGPLRIVSPTQIIMDRLAAYAHWRDNQSFDQAVMVAKRQQVDWAALRVWSEREGIKPEMIDRLKNRSQR
ncbi:MAG: hypothetical protein WC971_01530 [Coriobacteriia bacterium]